MPGNKLGVRNVRFAGEMDVPMDKVVPLIGSPGENWHFAQLSSEACQVLLGGEVCEWRVAEYARDGMQLGMEKAVITIGHVGSERAGMEYLAGEIAKAHPEIQTLYVECEEVYGYLR